MSSSTAAAAGARPGPARTDEASRPAALDRPLGAGASSGPPELPFAQVLSDVFGEADALQHRASDAVDDLLSGRSDDVHRVVLDMERANLGLRLAVEVRNRALEAYQEIMRMQL
ncbi:MAG: flagellar hook-basal body complex protein FliE [Planctomycetota bacterium]|nr:MAG: flagellar hook-basal body complex protein FliE [Planctomycetota bacterium]